MTLTYNIHFTICVDIEDQPAFHIFLQSVTKISKEFRTKPCFILMVGRQSLEKSFLMENQSYYLALHQLF